MLADKSLVACRKCPQCRSNRIDEWVGRCIAESKTSVATSFITLTYGLDETGNQSHARTAILTYSDVQKYFKQLRKRGYPCRYFAVGELGSKKGRTHWHVLVFWQENVPISMMDYGNNEWNLWNPAIPVERAIEWDKRFWEPCWPHGFSHWTPIKKGHEKGSIAYACKYINKDLDDPAAQSKLAMSKLPPLGAAYFIDRAQRFVDERLSPQDPFYEFPGEAHRKNGNVIRFMLRGKLQEIFLDAFITKWREQVGGHEPPSKYVEEYLDAKARKESGDYEYHGRVAEEKRHIRSISAKTLDDRRFWMNPPFGFTDRDINIDPDTLLPCVSVGEGAFLYYYQDHRGTKGWYPNPVKEKPVPSVDQVLARISNRPGRKWTPSKPHEWVVHMSEKWEVIWISLGVTSLGRYRLMKTLDATGKRVWGRSLTR
ncbi:hypothetical protein ASD74_06465 [Rhizobium sp. Root564]|nr:hypothetical protein ASD74_06465 [Rhizobium sp. Root564]